LKLSHELAYMGVCGIDDRTELSDPLFPLDRSPPPSMLNGGRGFS